MRVWDRILAVAAAAMLAACNDDPPPAPTPPAPTPPAPAGNTAPNFVSGSAGALNENATGTAYFALARDANGDSVTYSLTGADAALFTINPGLGAVEFITPPDFELPDDADRNNVYQITIIASDGMAQTLKAVPITVNDVGEPFVVNRRGTGFDFPLFAAGAGDGSGRLFVVELGGAIKILDPDTGVTNPAAFLDLSAEILLGGERGLLGLSFAPDYAASGAFYVYMTTLAGDTEIRRYTVSAGDPDLADPLSAELVLRFTPVSDHHLAGWIGFGPDGFLYITIGDGDSALDPSNPAQDTTSYQGKLLRIDVGGGDDFPADADRNFAVPAGNPFPIGGADLPEIYAYGLRNPFRASFDPLTGDLLLGDVGEDTREEIDLVPPGSAGLNFGWVRFEGTDVLVAAAAAPGAVPPVIQYNHGAGPFEGDSVTGGVVNRGPVPAMRSNYIFGDYISGNIWSIPVRNFMQGATLTTASLTRQTDAFVPIFGAIDSIASFGTDDDGNVYVVDIGGAPGQGEIFRLENP